MRKVAVFASLMTVAIEVSGMSNPYEMAQNDHSLSRICLEKIVTINNSLDDWNRRYPSAVKYAQSTIRFGLGISRGYLGLSMGQRLVSLFGNQYRDYVLSGISMSTNFLIKTLLLREGCSEQQVDEYAGAVLGLEKKMFTVLDMLLADGSLSSNMHSLKIMANAGLISHGYSDSARKYVNAFFSYGTILAKMANFLPSVREVNNASEESLKDISESHLKIIPKIEVNDLDTNKGVFYKINQMKDVFFNKISGRWNRFQHRYKFF